MAWNTPSATTSGQVLTSAFWNAQVRENMDELAPFMAVWSTYTPALTASSVNPTLGTGSSVLGRYVKVGRLVIGYAHITFGTSGVAAGTGTYRVSLPVNRERSDGQRIGYGRILDASASQYRPIQASALAGIGAGNANLERLDQTTSVTNLEAAVPWTWDTSDQIWFYFEYEAAS